MTTKFDLRTLDQGYECDWPVLVKQPVDGGTVQEQEFMARFRTPTTAEQEELKGIADLNERLKRALQIGFVGLAKSEGEELTPETFEAMWRMQHVQMALIRSYTGFQTGSPAKN